MSKDSWKADRFMIGWNDDKAKWAVFEPNGDDSPCTPRGLFAESEIIDHLQNDKYVYRTACAKGMHIVEPGESVHPYPEDDPETLRANKNQNQWDNLEAMRNNMPANDDCTPAYDIEECGCDQQ